MLKIIADKAKAQRLENIELINPKRYNYPIENNECDYIMLCTVLHEIDDKAALLNEIYRILKTNGRLIIIEFLKMQTPMGPPSQQRISTEQTKMLTERHGLILHEQRSLGENLYILVLKK